MPYLIHKFQYLKYEGHETNATSLGFEKVLLPGIRLQEKFFLAFILPFSLTLYVCRG